MKKSEKIKSENLRFMVVETSCSGQTTIAEKLFEILSMPHGKMDRLL